MDRAQKRKTIRMALIIAALILIIAIKFNFLDFLLTGSSVSQGFTVGIKIINATNSSSENGGSSINNGGSKKEEYNREVIIYGIVINENSTAKKRSFGKDVILSKVKVIDENQVKVAIR